MVYPGLYSSAHGAHVEMVQPSGNEMVSQLLEKTNHANAYLEHLSGCSYQPLPFQPESVNNCCGLCRHQLWAGCMCAWLVHACSSAQLALRGPSILSTALHVATRLEQHRSPLKETCKLPYSLASPSGKKRPWPLTLCHGSALSSMPCHGYLNGSGSSRIMTLALLSTACKCCLWCLTLSKHVPLCFLHRTLWSVHHCLATMACRDMSS